MQDTILVKNGAGADENIVAGLDADGNKSWVTIDKRFELAINQGQIDGYSVVDKFGENLVITTASDPEDMWEGGGEYIYDADGTAPIVSIASTSGSDTVDVKVTGLDINGDEVVQTITLAGTTRQPLTTALWRALRLENDGSTDLVGIVFCYTGTGTVPTLGDAEIRAVIDNGNNQTLMAIYTIPAGKVGFLHRGELGINWTGGASAGGDYARMYYKSRRFGKVFKIKKSVSVMTSANSIFQDARSFPDIIPAKTDIRLVIQEVSTTMGAWGTFDIMLVDEGKFTAGYLAEIGQPGF